MSEKQKTIYSITSLGFIHLLKDELLTYGYIKQFKSNKNIQIKNLAIIIMNYLSIKLFISTEYLTKLHYNFNNPSIETLKIYETQYKLNKFNINAMDSQFYIALINNDDIHNNNDIDIIDNILRKYAHHKMKFDGKSDTKCVFDDDFKMMNKDTINSTEYNYTTKTSTEYNKTSLIAIGNNIEKLSLMHNNFNSAPLMFGGSSSINYFNYLKDIVLLNLNKEILETDIKQIYHGCYTKQVVNEYASHRTNYEYIVISFNKENSLFFNINQYIIWSCIVGWSNMHFQRFG